jgi:hypothetical protein
MFAGLVKSLLTIMRPIVAFDGYPQNDVFEMQRPRICGAGAVDR